MWTASENQCRVDDLEQKARWSNRMCLKTVKICDRCMGQLFVRRRPEQLWMKSMPASLIFRSCTILGLPMCLCAVWQVDSVLNPLMFRLPFSWHVAYSTSIQANAAWELCILRHMHMANKPDATRQAADSMQFADFGYATHVLWPCTAALIQQPWSSSLDQVFGFGALQLCTLITASHMWCILLKMSCYYLFCLHNHMCIAANGQALCYRSHLSQLVWWTKQCV